MQKSVLGLQETSAQAYEKADYGYFEYSSSSSFYLNQATRPININKRHTYSMN